MKHFKKIFALATFAAFFVSLAACNPYYVNTLDLGQRATSDEIRTHFTGKSFRALSYLGDAKGKKLPDWDTEYYFQPGGALYIVNLDEPLVFYGTWSVHKKTEETPIDTLVRSITLEVSEGKTRRLAAVEGVALFSVHIQKDGSVILDEMGGLNGIMSKPQNDFPSKNRFNSLMPIAQYRVK